MSNDNDGRSIFEQCAPLADSTTAATKPQPRVHSPSQRGPGITGPKTLVIACIADRREDSSGRYLGETLYPVTAKLQGYPAIARLTRTVEFHPSLTTDGNTALLARKVPFPGGKPNSWTDSAERAVNDSVGRWGSITSDHKAQRYNFEPMANAPDIPDKYPKLRDLCDELLGEFVIESVAHEVIQRLIPHSPPTAPSLEEDDDSAY